MILEATYVNTGLPTESDIAAVLDNRVAGTAEVDVHIRAVVHPELPTVNHENAILHSRDMGRAVDLATDEQTLLNALDGQTGIRLSVGGGNGHVDYAVAKMGDGRRHSCGRARGRQHDVQVMVIVYRHRGHGRCGKSTPYVGLGFILIFVHCKCRDRGRSKLRSL